MQYVLTDMIISANKCMVGMYVCGMYFGVCSTGKVCQCLSSTPSVISLSPVGNLINANIRTYLMYTQPVLCLTMQMCC